MEREPIERISNGKLVVVRLIGEGKSTSEIARQLDQRVYTIDTHCDSRVLVLEAPRRLFAGQILKPWQSPHAWSSNQMLHEYPTRGAAR